MIILFIKFLVVGIVSCYAGVKLYRKYFIYL